MAKIKMLTIVLEWSDGEFSGFLKGHEFFFTTEADTVTHVTRNLRGQLEDYLIHEGRNSSEWKSITIDNVRFKRVYKLSAFFEHFKELKISAIANRAGINTNLVQQYVSGNKRASETQTRKLEHAVHSLADELKSVSLC